MQKNGSETIRFVGCGTLVSTNEIYFTGYNNSFSTTGQTLKPVYLTLTLMHYTILHNKYNFLLFPLPPPIINNIQQYLLWNQFSTCQYIHSVS